MRKLGNSRANQLVTTHKSSLFSILNILGTDVSFHFFLAYLDHFLKYLGRSVEYLLTFSCKILSYHVYVKHGRNAGIMDSYSHVTRETAEAGKVLDKQVLIIQGDDQSMAREGIKIVTSRASLLHYTWGNFFSSFNLIRLKFLLQNYMWVFLNHK